ncbi:MAG: hypothetical protein H7296_11340 [Bacteroidia bacterium]|nr:hypothetical protein [Bacteroidia bacterium]
MQTNAQNAPILEPQLLYSESNLVGINLNSFKFGGVYYRHGWHKTGTQLNHYEVELTRIKHPKEVRRSGFSENPNQYTFGRLNVVFFLRNGLGQTITITDRPYKNAVGLNFIYTIGATVAFLKPVYIDVYYPYTDGKPGGFLISERYEAEKHQDVFRIYGNSSATSGLSETSLNVGGYGRAGLQVEWGPYPDETRSLEAGVTVDAFAKGLPIMAHSNADQFFYGFYLAFNWGKKK